MQHRAPLQHARQYGDDKKHFTIRCFHGGEFTWIQDDIKLYLFGKEEVYNVDSQSFGVHVLDTIVGNLGYSLPITYMYKESGKGLADGLRKLITEADVEDMIQELGVDKTVEIYFVPPGSENVDD